MVLGYRAMRLTRTRPADELIASIDSGSRVRSQLPELGLLILHELVLNGHEVDHDGWYLDWAQSNSHLLAHLPLHPISLEGEFCSSSPIFSDPGTAAGMTRMLPKDDDVELGTLLSGFGERMDVDGALVAAPFRDWVENSNGAVEISVFEAGGSFNVTAEPAPVPTLLAREIDVVAGLELLFSLTFASGAYGRGPGVAYSRLRTWEAVSGLLGREWPCEIAPLAVEIQESRWIRIEPASTWFHRIAWDVFLVVVIGERIVTIAATDTD